MGTKTQKLSNVIDQIVEWQSVFTGDGSTGLTAVAGRGYFIDTTSGTVTVTLPASPKAGDVVQLKDYARTWATNNVTTASALFDGISKTVIFSTTGQTVTLVYMDGTKGWSLVNEDTTTDLSQGYITATGGTITTSGNYKIHSFTGDGCFVVSSLGQNVPCAQASTVDYLVVAGGGGGGGAYSGGGAGAGGFRESKDSTLASPHSASPLAATTGITVTATTYPITVGAGGAGAPGGTPNAPIGRGVQGSNSVFSTITSTGGGGGGGGTSSVPSLNPGGSGGSGGGGQGTCSGISAPTAGSGNTPPVSPSQGNPGGTSSASAPVYGSGGGGGAGGAGTAGTSSVYGNGGVGVTTSISGSPTAYSGGGGGGKVPGSYPGPGGNASPCGTGGAGAHQPCSTTPAGNGTANRGGGAGGGSYNPEKAGGDGGKGIVIIRYKYQ